MCFWHRNSSKLFDIRCNYPLLLNAIACRKFINVGACSATSWTRQSAVENPSTHTLAHTFELAGVESKWRNSKYMHVYEKTFNDGLVFLLWLVLSFVSCAPRFTRIISLKFQAQQIIVLFSTRLSLQFQFRFNISRFSAKQAAPQKQLIKHGNLFNLHVRW